MTEYIIGVLLIGGLLQIVICQPGFWKKAKTVSIVLFVILLLADIALAFKWDDNPISAVLFILTGYSLFNLYRVHQSRLQNEHLRRVSLKTSGHLMAGMIVAFILWLVVKHEVVVKQRIWIILAIIQLVVGIILLSSTIRHNVISKKIRLTEGVNDSAAPTLSVVIPARNETDSLNECLMSLISCDYPKLEILVLDDQSSVRRTPEIIRSFAHDGVVFVAGSEPPKGWLAKNWAYQRLLEAANGEVIIFCGADTRFSTQSLRFLVALIVKRKKTIVSILPANVLPLKLQRRLLQPLRYAWEICLPRRALSRPPVLSTCWLGKKDFINSQGGFKAVKNRISPESYFARCALKKDGYSFLRYDGVISDKPSADQLETAIRVRYPQLRAQIETVALLTLIEAIVILGTLPLLIVALIDINWLLVGLSLGSIVLYGLVFGITGSITYRSKSLLSFFSWPIQIITDLWLMHLSMWRYEFGMVLWKGRSVAEQVMRSDD